MTVLISSVSIITDSEVLDAAELDDSAIGIGEDNVVIGAVVSDGKVTETVHSGVIDIKCIGTGTANDDVGISPRLVSDIKGVVAIKTVEFITAGIPIEGVVARTANKHVIS